MVYIRWKGEGYSNIEKIVRTNRSSCGYDVRILHALVDASPIAVYIAANRVRSIAIDTIDKVFQSCDVIVTPSTASVAPQIPPEAVTSGLYDLSITTKLIRFTNLANFVGIPALSVPIGYSEDGLPTSLQIMGRRWFACERERELTRTDFFTSRDEDVVLGVGRVLSAFAERKRPRVFFDVLDLARKKREERGRE